MNPALARTPLGQRERTSRRRRRGTFGWLLTRCVRRQENAARTISLVAHPLQYRRCERCSLRTRVVGGLVVLWALVSTSRVQAQGIQPAGAMLPALQGPFDVATAERQLNGRSGATNSAQNACGASNPGTSIACQ